MKRRYQSRHYWGRLAQILSQKKIFKYRLKKAPTNITHIWCSITCRKSSGYLSFWMDIHNFLHIKATKIIHNGMLYNQKLDWTLNKWTIGCNLIHSKPTYQQNDSIRFKNPLDKLDFRRLKSFLKLFLRNPAFHLFLYICRVKKRLNMKNVTEMTDMEKSPNKANILYIVQIQQISGISDLRIKRIYTQL